MKGEAFVNESSKIVSKVIEASGLGLTVPGWQAGCSAYLMKEQGPECRLSLFLLAPGQSTMRWGLHAGPALAPL